MRKIEGQKLSNIGKILSTVLAKDDTLGFCSPNERGFIQNAKLSIKEVLASEHLKHAEAATEWETLVERIDEVLSEADIKAGFEPKKSAEDNDEVEGQLEFEEGKLPPVPRKAPSVLKFEADLDEAIKQKVQAGHGKTDTCKQVAAEQLADHNGVKARFAALEESGNITKDGKVYRWANQAVVPDVIEDGTPNFSTKPRVPHDVREALEKAISEGSSMVAAISYAHEITGMAKGVIGGHFHSLLAEGAILKDGERFTLPPMNPVVPADYSAVV